MCGRFGLTRPDRLRLERFGLQLGDALPRFNIRPGESIFVIHGDGEAFQTRRARWGIDATGPRPPLINVRSERLLVAGLPRFTRALVPADVFYEWQARAGSRVKVPFAVARVDRGPLMFGGVVAAASEGGQVAILTMPATPQLARVHDRMPVLVAEDSWAQWLDPALGRPALAEVVDAGARTPLDLWQISTRVNRPKADDPSILEPATAGLDEPLDLFGAG